MPIEKRCQDQLIVHRPGWRRLPRGGGWRGMRYRGLVCLLAACGCGRTSDIQGTVTYQGQPLSHGNVKIIPADGIPRDAMIQPDGSYHLIDIPRGPARLAVCCVAPETAAAIRRAGRGGKAGASTAETSPLRAAPAEEPEDWMVIPLRYADFNESGLRLDVELRSHALDISLQSP